MSNAVTKASFVPNKNELAEAGKLSGGIALGIIASHAACNTVGKINSPVGHGVLLAGGFLGACKVKNPLLKAICAGAAVYGGLRLAAKLTAVATDPETTSGIAGALPESVKSALRKFIPTFAGIEEVAGLSGTDDDFGDLSLDDASGDDVSGFGAAEEAIGAVDLRLAA